MNLEVAFGVAGIVLGLLVVVPSRRKLEARMPETEMPYERAVRNRRRGDRLIVGPVMLAVSLAVVIDGVFHVL